MDIEVYYDGRTLELFKTGADDNTIQKAVARAANISGNLALRRLKTESSREIRGRKKLKAGFVGKGLPTSKKGSVSNVDSLEWKMKVSGRPVPLGEYPHRQTAKGVTVYVNAAGGRKLVKGAFVARMRSGHEGVFKRMGKKRLPIEELYSSTLANVFGDTDMIPKVHAFGQSTFTAEFSRVLPVQLAKLLP